MQIPGITELFKAKKISVNLLKDKAQYISEISTVLESKGASRREISSPPSSDLLYIRVGTPLLLRSKPLLTDVFIKLSEHKYLKIFQKNDVFTNDDLDKYLNKKNIHFFYVLQSDSAIITQQLSSIIANMLQANPLPMAESVGLSISTTETVHDLARQLNFGAEAQELAKKNVALVLNEMGKTPNLREILGRMEKNKEKYIAAHSHMLAGVACMLATQMKWGSETSFKKLTMAALLHDMAITNEKLCRLKDDTELQAKLSEFSQSDVKDYRSHPRRAAVLIQGMKEIPTDVDRIVHQHHELSNGMGFPDKMSAVNIHPLAIVLIVSHDIVDWCFDHDGVFVPEDFCASYASRYQAGHFRKILKEVEKIKI